MQIEPTESGAPRWLCFNKPPRGRMLIYGAQDWDRPACSGGGAGNKTPEVSAPMDGITLPRNVWYFTRVKCLCTPDRTCHYHTYHLIFFVWIRLLSSLVSGNDSQKMTNKRFPCAFQNCPPGHLHIHGHRHHRLRADQRGLLHDHQRRGALAVRCSGSGECKLGACQLGFRSMSWCSFIAEKGLEIQ